MMNFHDFETIKNLGNFFLQNLRFFDPLILYEVLVRATALESASTVGKSRGGNARSLARVTNIIFYKLFLQTIIF